MTRASQGLLAKVHGLALPHLLSQAPSPKPMEKDNLQSGVTLLIPTPTVAKYQMNEFYLFNEDTIVEYHSTRQDSTY